MAVPVRCGRQGDDPGEHGGQTQQDSEQERDRSARALAVGHAGHASGASATALADQPQARPEHWRWPRGSVACGLGMPAGAFHRIERLRLGTMPCLRIRCEHRTVDWHFPVAPCASNRCRPPPTSARQSALTCPVAAGQAFPRSSLAVSSFLARPPGGAAPLASTATRDAVVDWSMVFPIRFHKKRLLCIRHEQSLSAA